MMRAFLLGLALLLLGAGESLADSLKVDGKRYDYLVYAAPKPRVIIIAFHGFTGDGAAMAKHSRLHERGAPIVVAYPSGWWKTWDGRPGSVDVRMTAKLIDILRQEHGRLPVCVTGISAGATMAWRVAAELPVDALVAVAGPLNPVSGRPPGRPRVLELQGDADTMVPLEGGQGLFSEIPPAQDGIDLFRRAGSQAELRVIKGGGHDWDLDVGYDTTGEVLRFCGAKPGTGTTPTVEADLPGGSWSQTCRNAARSGETVTAECQAKNGKWREARLALKNCADGPLANDDGRLVCESSAPAEGITLYENKSFGGRAMTFTGPVPDLGVHGFSLLASSLRTQKVWFVCTKPRYRGDCTKTTGSINLTKDWNDRIASLRPAN
jgi:poly(3-hydroxybutyrate) depolymerase